MWIIRRNMGSHYFGAYTWERSQSLAVRFESRRAARLAARIAADHNSGVRVVRLVPNRRTASGAKT